jgi:hypothetical protein
VATVGEYTRENLDVWGFNLIAEEMSTSAGPPVLDLIQG